MISILGSFNANLILIVSNQLLYIIFFICHELKAVLKSVSGGVLGPAVVGAAHRLDRITPYCIHFPYTAIHCHFLYWHVPIHITALLVVGWSTFSY